MHNVVSGDIWKYGDPEGYDLKRAIADQMSVKAENIVLGEGIDALLGYLAKLFVEPGSKVVTSLGAYPTFNYHVNGCGGELIFVPYKNDQEDLQSLIVKAEKSKARLIYYANPDNPMGTAKKASEIESLIKFIPKGCILLIDEAYSDFAPESYVPNIKCEDCPVIRLRTFSKAYGMAGARVGFGIGPSSLIKNFDKIRNHFGINRVAQVGALVALQDQEYLRSVIKNVTDSKNGIKQIAVENGLKPISSFTNFVAIDCGRNEEFAKRLLSNLIEFGVFLRMPSVWPLSRCIRVTAGKQTELNCLAEFLPKALKKSE